MAHTIHHIHSTPDPPMDGRDEYTRARGHNKRVAIAEQMEALIMEDTIADQAAMERYTRRIARNGTV